MIKVFSNAKDPYTAYFSEQVKLADKKVILSLAGFSLEKRRNLVAFRLS